MKYKLLMPISVLIFSTNFANATIATNSSVSNIYFATLNRVPDSKGLEYWVNSGFTIEEIAQSFFEQPETIAKYPIELNNVEFIREIYKNIFGREPDEKGLDYWVNELSSGNMQRDDMILALLRGASSEDIKTMQDRFLASESVENITLVTPTVNIYAGVSVLQCTNLPEGLTNENIIVMVDGKKLETSTTDALAHITIPTIKGNTYIITIQYKLDNEVSEITEVSMKIVDKEAEKAKEEAEKEAKISENVVSLNKILEDNKYSSLDDTQRTSVVQIVKDGGSVESATKKADAYVEENNAPVIVDTPVTTTQNTNNGGATGGGGGGF